MVPPELDLATPCSASGTSDWSTGQRILCGRCWSVIGNMVFLLVHQIQVAKLQLVLQANIPWRFCNLALNLDAPPLHQMSRYRQHLQATTCNRRNTNGRGRKQSSQSFEPTSTKPLAIPPGWIMVLVTSLPS